MITQYITYQIYWFYWQATHLGLFFRDDTCLESWNDSLCEFTSAAFTTHISCFGLLNMNEYHYIFLLLKQYTQNIPCQIE